MDSSQTAAQVVQIVATPEIVSSQYFPILLFLAVAIGLSCAIMVIPFLLNKRHQDREKLSPYECGFEGEGKVRNEFDVQFYLVAILFIIFDLEVAFLFPWAVSLAVTVEAVGIDGCARFSKAP